MRFLARVASAALMVLALSGADYPERRPEVGVIGLDYAMLEDPAFLLGQRVTPEFTVSCYKADRFICVPRYSGQAGSLVIIADVITGEPGLRIADQCPTVEERCPLLFHSFAFRVDVIEGGAGLTTILRTGEITTLPSW